MNIERKYNFYVDEKSDSLRSDSFIASRIPELSRSALCGDMCVITINGRIVRKSTKVRSGDNVVFVYRSEVFDSVEPQDIPLDILYEDSDMLVIDKKQGMVVHPGAGNWSGTVANALAYRYGQSFIDDMSDECDITRPGIVHRLDKDTSGILVVALNSRSHALIADQFKNRETEKHYTAVCDGFFDVRQGTIECLIGRDVNDRKLFAPVKTGGKDSISHYSVIKQYRDAAFTDVRILTGRTHQIRVHMKSIGHPVIGDVLYNRHCNRFPDCTLMLHSTYLRIAHPSTGKTMEFICPVPKRFTMLEERLAQNIK